MTVKGGESPAGLFRIRIIKMQTGFTEKMLRIYRKNSTLIMDICGLWKKRLKFTTRYGIQGGYKDGTGRYCNGQ